ncbi:MAG: Holliday junction branch migration protein RuvA [Pseudomonadota bacterium]|mgnify:CR=1 FL=1
MIGHLNGKLMSKQPPLLLVEVAGVGYELEAPLSTIEKLPEPGAAIQLHTHLSVREDAHVLFGFITLAEKNLFRELIKLNGVGPKLALSILSGLSVGDFWNLVRNQDAARLTQLQGVGKKTAERLVLELKDRTGAQVETIGAMSGGATSSPLHEARRALETLGYKPAEAIRMSEAAYQDGMNSEQLVRESLKRAVRG